jgi:hypothetical protein
LSGLSYSFDYNNARFMLLDQFTPTDGKASDGSTYSTNNNAIASQQTWISSTLASKAGDEHAFVFSHKQLFGGNHTDTLFGTPASNAAQQNAFIKSMDDNKVGYLFTGHDHMHSLSSVTSPDGTSQVNQVICASDSSKFYTPVALANHGTDAAGTGYPNAGQVAKNRETPIAQDLYTSGYYIVTVQGPRVTVDFYSADSYATQPGLRATHGDLTLTPQLSFSKKETFGYSLNGKQILVASGGDLSAVQDTFGATSMHLGGTNTSTATDFNGRLLSKSINTGWTAKSGGLLSDALTLWGMEDLGHETTDTPFTLTMSYETDPGYKDAIGLARLNDDGTLPLLGGTLNGDGTISAAINRSGTYAVVPEPGTMSLIATGLLTLVTVVGWNWRRKGPCTK